MTFKVCYNLNSGRSRLFEEIELADRFECARFVDRHFSQLQRFSDGSGNVFGYAVQLNDRGKPTALLYAHKVAQLIWIDFD